MASADKYTSHGGGGVGEAYTCDTPVSAFKDACAVCVWLEQAMYTVLCVVRGGCRFNLCGARRGGCGYRI